MGQDEQSVATFPKATTGNSPDKLIHHAFEGKVMPWISIVRIRMFWTQAFFNRLNLLARSKLCLHPLARNPLTVIGMLCKVIPATPGSGGSGTFYRH